ncbi:WXG100 family type VII secretion target [Amycolatopsis sp. WQ 127309]|uniref:WXG100 family type VII secretion target n=1 Tax=Amycolatopsis sp. WQ 127309 TaxID=2932773 RepID=UPI001FF5F6AB|nr:WXG100 family type VII secretion target [Amycolatopsis sp. WQ 127309]UOZ06972.1 WXG100 family type VII secretion target [Amycolatopsis sp. WQ 127309]
MVDEFRMDPAGVDRVVARLRDACDSGSAGLRTFDGYLDQLDGCWGDDESGEAFAKNYVGTADQAKEGMRSMLEGLKSMAENLAQSTKNFQGLDELAAKEMDRRIGDGLK